MPFSCPYKNTPEWKRLFLAVGKDRAYELYTENNFDIPTNFVVRAQDIRKIIKLYKTEIGQDKLIKVKKALDRYNTVNNTSHSLDITPIGESTESKVKLVLNFNPRNAQKYQDKLDRRSEEDKMFKELEEESETEEFVRDIDYYMGDEQLMQQEEGVFYQTDEKTVNYQLKAVNILLSDRAKQIFTKGEKAKWDLNKILTELAVPKEQKQLLLELGIADREQLALE